MADPIQLRPVLTMKAMDAPSWEPALSFPLPENPDFELLDRARQEVLIYLDWVTNDLAQVAEPDELRREINRAAARLIEISLHWPAALAADVEAHLAADRAEHERQWRAHHPDP